MRVIETEFLIIKEFHNTGKTSKFEILNKSNTLLGYIQWYGAFRKYCFYPSSNTIWDNKCLNDVLDVLKTLMNERKEKRFLDKASRQNP